MLNISEVRSKMGRVGQLFTEDIGSIRTGRATSALIENVAVAVYGGQKMRLIELGSIGVPDARSLTFQPWDTTTVREIANQIQAANLGFMPVVDGALIRISLPMLTREQREDYVKLLGRKLEGVRVMVRDIRGEFRKKIIDAKQEKTVGEDEFKRDEAELQKVTDEYIAKLEKIALEKENPTRG
jgi:ribosome recycling factor